jgi:hypothetical protein
VANLSKKRLARRGRLQVALTIAFAVLTVVATAVPMWIERVSGFSPDGGNGELELLLAVPFGLGSVVLGVLAWRTRRRSTSEGRSGVAAGGWVR